MLNLGKLWVYSGILLTLLTSLASAQNGTITITAAPPKPKHVAATVATTTAPKAKVLTTTQVQQNPLLLLQQFTVTDLQAALADANAQTPPDTVGAACWSALLALVNSGAASPLALPSGAISALQKARDAKALLANLQSTNGPLSGLNTACAPVIMDAQTTVLGLGLALGLVANPVGAPAVLAGLPAGIAAFLALPKLPIPIP